MKNGETPRLHTRGKLTHEIQALHPDGSDSGIPRRRVSFWPQVGLTLLQVFRVVRPLNLRELQGPDLTILKKHRGVRQPQQLHLIERHEGQSDITVDNKKLRPQQGRRLSSGVTLQFGAQARRKNRN